MHKVNQTAIVGYSAEQMYRLVNNYKDYPDFLPGCVASETLDDSEKELTAKLVISKAGINQNFTTHNTMEPNHVINMNLVEGPFRFLRGQWVFDAIDEYSCYIRFKLEFEFSNKMIGMLFGQVFQQLTGKMIDAFKQRAKEVYGV